MRLLGGATSVYVRIVRTQIELCGLADKVTFEIVATRVPDSPLHAHNPTGKIPTLVLADGTALSEARLICEYLDTLHSGAPFAPIGRRPHELAFEGLAIGFTDGASVWVREARRSSSEQSPSIIEQEHARAARCLEYFNNTPEKLGPASTYAMCCILATLWRLQLSIGEFDWLTKYPNVADWYTRAVNTPAFAASAPL